MITQPLKTELTTLYLQNDLKQKVIILNSVLNSINIIIKTLITLLVKRFDELS
jgi:hypothetical protein